METDGQRLPGDRFYPLEGERLPGYRFHPLERERERDLPVDGFHPSKVGMGDYLVDSLL